MDTLQAEIGVFRTEHASKYLQQLCKHFAHKVEVRYDTERGEAALPPGPAKMTAADGVLRIEITGADDEALARARGIIDVHLAKFAFREAFERMDWQPA